ncbi:T9SS type A sorting domain-containing protein [Spirosoma jeollabukense]
MRKLYFFAIAIYFLLVTPINGWAQCSTPPLPSCNGCIAVTENGNKNLSAGTYCVTTAITNLNVSGSAVICISGDGQIVSGNLNGGTIIYNGGTVSDPIKVGNLGGGTLRIRSSVSLTNMTAINSSSTLIVENGATLTVSSLDVNGTLVVDRSVLYVNNAFAVNSGGNVCFNNGLVNTSQFRSNDQANSSGVTNAMAKGCFAIRSSFNGFNNSLTNTSNISVCLPGASIPSNIGSAAVNTNCSGASPDGGCYKALPVRLISFQAQALSEDIRLDWATSLEQNFDYFQVERSTDAIGFEAISPRIASLADKSGNRQYTWTDVTAKNGTFYYRLKQVDLDNTYSYSKIVGVVFASEDKGVAIKPNSFSDELAITINTSIAGTYVIQLYSALGKLQLTVTGEKSESVVTHMLATANLPAGIYFAIVRLGNQYFVRKLIKS